jgi:PKD repeat protein
MLRLTVVPPRRGLVIALALTALVAAVFHTARASAAAGDIGTENFSYDPLGGSPTQTKPESKLWFNDNLWWASMFNGSEHHIFKLNAATGQWTDTGTLLDARDSANADTLWDAAANKLYVASHIFTESAAATTAGNAGRVYRYSYNSSTDTYSLDSGFPVTINAARTESLVLDKDSTGRLWATWVADRRVYVAHTSGTDTSWSAPYIVPGSTTLDVDDISSLVHFGGNKIGVMWSNQSAGDGRFWFAVHTDGTGDTAANWTTGPISGLPSTDDHISLKADGEGRVFAAVKTSETNSSSPLNMLLRRNTNGTWSSATYGTVANSHTRPIVVLDEPNNTARMFATCPQPPMTSGQSGGDICEKTTSLDTLSFSSGIGTAVIRDNGSPEVNDVTSTKQGVNALTGLVIQANNKTTNVYWTRVLSLGAPPPTSVAADFTATPTSGTAPLNVQFSDASTGSPTTWSWNFGDGATSTQQSPSHQYTQPGTYDVTLTASKPGSTDTETKTGFITVGSTPPPGGDTQTFTASADSMVKSTSASNNYGTDPALRVRQGTSSTDASYRSYLKFDVANLSGTVTGVKLRLFSTDGSRDGGAVYGVHSFWTESGITWSNAPALPASSLAAFGATTTNSAVELNLPASAVSGNGPVSFAIANASTDSAYYSSRQGATPPQLVVTTDGGSPPPPGSAPTANFSGTPTSGSAPLSVAFTDTSTGTPTSWSWSFGDGSTSTEQSPTHVYDTPGTYDVTLTATNANGSDGETKTGYVTVGSAPPPPPGGQTLTPVADAQVKSTSPSTNYGTLNSLRIRQGTSSTDVTYRTYLKFTVTGLTGPVSGAKLRLFSTDGGPDGGSVFRVTDNTWTEAGLTFANAPAIGTTSLGTAGAVGTGVPVEINLGNAITGNGTYSFALTTTSSNSVIYDSREGTTPPQLILPG